MTAAGAVARDFNVDSLLLRSLTMADTRANQKSSPCPTATYASCAARSSATPKEVARAAASNCREGLSVRRIRCSDDQVRNDAYPIAAAHAKSSVRRTGNLVMNASDDACGRGYYNISTARVLMDVFAIVNPLSGTGANPDIAAGRVALLMQHFVAAGITGTVYLTERRGHAVDLASVAIAQGARTVLAWGGDGTINEIGSVVAGTSTALGIVPAGSGNGFAAELGVPWQPADAIDVAIHGRDRMIDAGELDGRLFFNIAGIGFDAVIAEQFNARGIGNRGMGPYVRIGIRETFRYQAGTYRVTLD